MAISRLDSRMDLYNTVLEGSDRTATPVYLLHTIPLDGNYLRTSLDGIDHVNDIVSLDFRDHGLSPESKWKHELKFRNFAKDVEKLRKRRGDKKIILFAHGIGGFVALNYLMWNHKRVEKLVLFETAVDSKYRIKLAWNIRERYNNQVKDMLEPFRENASATALEVKFFQSFAMHFKTPDYARAKYLMESSNQMGLIAYALLHKELEQYNMKGIGRKFKNKALLVTADESLWPREELERLRKEFPKADELVLETIGHYGMVENPSAFWEPILRWIEGEE